MLIKASTEDSVGSRTRPPVDGILGAVGDTPLVALRRFLGHRRVDLWAKLEQSNPGGSAKARPATLMLREAFASGKVGAETTVIESSSGNMGVGLAQVCRYLGLRFVCVADARTDPIKIRAMEALGADVRVVTRPDPATGDLLAARLRLVAHLLETTPNSYWPDQYANSARVVAVDALGSVLFGGRRAPRRLPGFGAGVEPALAHGLEPARVVRVTDLECVTGCRRLVDREAILAGASSGGVMWAVDALAAQVPAGSRCVAILADGGEGYLDTVYDDEWVTRELGCHAESLQELVAAVA